MKANKWQLDAAGFIYERDNSMLFSRMGTGKTYTNLLALQDWQDSGDIQRCLVSAPLRVCNTVWRQEAERWDIPVRFSLCTGEQSKTKQQNAIYDRTGAHLLVNHDLLPKILKENHGCDALIIDELSRFRNSTGKWQKAARFGGFKVATGSTGTPAPNGLTSLYGMAQAVGLGHIWSEYSRNHDKWLRRFFYPADYMQRKWIPFKETPQELADLIRPYTYTLEEGAVELPLIVQRRIDVQLPAKLRAKYEQMRSLSKLTDEEIVADTAGVVRMKLRQILSGFAYDANGEAVSLEDDYRLQVLRDIVAEQNGQPIILVYEFKAQLAEMLKTWPGMPYLGGGSKDDDETIRAWNAGEVPLLGLHPASAGHGLNLQSGGRALAWWQLPDDLEQYDQTIARLARRGQLASSVFSYEPAALDTVDQTVIAAAHGKRTTQDDLWAALRR
jgi:SNF2 family DNA or RNA helicase